MSPIEKLLEGYRAFRRDQLSDGGALYRELAERGQSPKVLCIACSDSRVDPAILTRSGPGEIFVVRNVANLIPPYQADEATYHGTSAALEFAVRHLEVEHIIVMGHSRCGGIRALVEGTPMVEDGCGKSMFLESWIKIGQPAKESVFLKAPEATPDQKADACEEEAIRLSLENLRTFPWIEQRIRAGKMTLHGWHFSIFTGILRIMDPATRRFATVPDAE